MPRFSSAVHVHHHRCVLSGWLIFQAQSLVSALLDGLPKPSHNGSLGDSNFAGPPTSPFRIHHAASLQHGTLLFCSPQAPASNRAAHFDALMRMLDACWSWEAATAARTPLEFPASLGQVTSDWPAPEAITHAPGRSGHAFTSVPLLACSSACFSSRPSLVFASIVPPSTGVAHPVLLDVQHRPASSAHMCMPSRTRPHSLWSGKRHSVTALPCNAHPLSDCVCGRVPSGAGPPPHHAAAGAAAGVCHLPPRSQPHPAPASNRACSPGR